MKTTTSGHLTDNGGIRGHSAGDIFPWRIMGRGTMDNLQYWVINPQGKKLSHWSTASEAYSAAKVLIKLLKGQS